MSAKWMSTEYLKAAPAGRVNRGVGVIEGISVCTAGEAKGHGVHLDQTFIETVSEMGASRKQGLKARFGHPNMCSTALGTFIGRFKNFRVVGNRVVADLFMSNEAKETPHGNLYEYVLGMAENEPDMFGTSIVFTPGRTYQYDDDDTKIIVDELSADPNKPMYVECSALHACDAVDDPAANDGLFSAFSKNTIAGQITEFLDLHPQVWELLNGNNALIEALSKYGKNFDEFMNAYAQYRAGQNVEEKQMSEEQKDELLEEVKDEPIVDGEAAADEVIGGAVEEVVAEQPAEEPAEEKPAEPEVQVESSESERKEFARMKKAFGIEIASEVFEAGGHFNDAREKYFDKVLKENEELRKKLGEMSSNDGGKLAEFSSSANEEKSACRIFDKKLYK